MFDVVLFGQNERPPTYAYIIFVNRTFVREILLVGRVTLHTVNSKCQLGKYECAQKAASYERIRMNIFCRAISYIL